MKNIVKQYRELRGPKKWLVYFGLNWIYWGLVHGIVYFVASDEGIETGKYLFMTTFMALFWTLVYDAFLYPRLTRKNRKEEQ